MIRRARSKADPTTFPNSGPAPADNVSEQGVGLLAALLVMLMISTLGATLMLTANTDLTVSDNYRAVKVALYEADSGLEQSVVDFLNDPNWIVNVVNPTLPVTQINPFPTTLSINGHTFTVATDGSGNAIPDYYSWGGTVTLGTGTFTRSVLLPANDFELANGKGSKAWIQFPVRGQGTGGAAEPSTQIVEADARVLVHRISIWDNAIFAGKGQSGATISGNVEVRGSIHIVGDPANPTILDWTGGGGVRNNYKDAASMSYFSGDAWKLPSLPLRDFDGEMVSTLDTDVRVNHGRIRIDGGSDLGQPHTNGNTYKETLDGVYTDQPVEMVSGSSEVFADEEGDYDISVNVPFPGLSDPYTDSSTGITWATHRAYLDANSLTIPYNNIDRFTPSFALSDGTNSIAWDQASQVLTINGIIRVNGSLVLGVDGGPNRRFEYDGTGTFYATDDIDIRWDLVPVDGYLDATQPTTDNLGLIADDDVIVANSSQLEIFAALYAEDEMTFNKQTTIAGAIVADYFNMGTDVPRIWQVPRLSGMLPPGMPGGDPLVFPSRVQLANWTQVR